MSRQLITEYRGDLDRIHSASGSKRESVIREAFKDLLKRWGKSKDLIFLAEHEYLPPAGNRCYIDGALVHSIRVPFGYWEAKDTNDDLDEEIRKKSAKGYPRDNIIYEDTATAVLIQKKREVARVPMDDDFAQWSGWGQQLLDLHIGYEQAKPFEFTRIDTPNSKRAKGSYPKPKLRSMPDDGLVIVDEDTQLTGIPPGAWDYRLGNRSAIDWVLDQHKEKKIKDPTVRDKFDLYRFSDYKESMIELLARVITVSLETVKITEAMRTLNRKGAS